jgi:hypothetical protein
MEGSKAFQQGSQSGMRRWQGRLIREGFLDKERLKQGHKEGLQATLLRSDLCTVKCTHFSVYFTEA